MAIASPQMNFFSKAMTAPAPSIPGLLYIPHYIDHNHSEYLLRCIDGQAWLNDLKRRVQHYGYRYDYKARSITKETRLGALPDWLLSVCDQLLSSRFFARMPEQVIVNEYLPGQGIAPHMDCVPCFEETIASLSLGSASVMDFTNSKTPEKASIFLEPESLMVMSAEARYTWKHGIACRKADHYNGNIFRRGRRISLTFRNVILSE